MLLDNFFSRIFLSLVIIFSGYSTGFANETIDPSLYSNMKWRLIGPYRGGRVTTVTGVKSNPLIYYMGAAGGGVWKTENAGTTWENISDGFFNVGTIGAVAVSQSDINVLYVGTGEAPIRGVTTSHGDGVYKSTDAGKTWTHIGLRKAGQISKIKIHPTNPDIAYVAVQGNIWGPTVERGVYKTKDGGKTWSHILKVNPETGAGDLTMDPTNPRILYAAMWHHGRTPWFVKSGGKGGGIYKTTDSGSTWKKLEGGLPDLIGKVGVDVSASNPSRVYAIVEGPVNEGGLFRSDDYGETWKLMNSTRILWARSWYYMHITADPVDENTVYVMNAPFMKSIDGGKTFEKKSLPHGDTHDHWINPINNKNMINANDGGATVTFDGGKSWSSIMNQPTAQFYRVITDNQEPYLIYGGQQDNSTVAIASRTFDSGIGVEDYFDVGGGESAHIAFDEDNPRLVYASTINGTLTEVDVENKRYRPIKPYPEYVFGELSRDLKYRTNWNAPVAISPHDPRVIYYGTQMLLQSSDRGVTWDEISPDLTKNEFEKQGLNGGPLTIENVGAEFYNTIFYIVESSHEKGTIWVGADDGTLSLTRDGGKNWETVTPFDMPEAMINAIEVSPHDPATVYIAVAGYKLNNFTPMIYKTTNFGKNWLRLDKRLPEDTFVRVVREDKEIKGLLYAGTEAGMFISFDDGNNWQSLELNLPPVPITDLTIRQGDLVAATQGRGFWVLDDISQLQQISPDLKDKNLHAFKPSPAKLIRTGGSGSSNEGKNPDNGVALKYFIKGKHDDALSIEIINSLGSVVRNYSSEEGDFERCIIGNMDQRIPFEVSYPTKKVGVNVWNWDMRRENLKCVENINVYAGFSGADATPGKYKAKISIGENVEIVPFDLLPDPRVEASQKDFEDLAIILDDVGSFFNEIVISLDDIRKSRNEIKALLDAFPEEDKLGEIGKAAVDRISKLEILLTQINWGTYEDEDSFPSMIDVQVRHVFDVFNEAGPPFSDGAFTRLKDLKKEWAGLEAELVDIKNVNIREINEWAKSMGVDHITPPRNKEKKDVS
ncbi:MAG: WD40/YVTN/BNR-like repeat-containing protein [Sphingomonadales bacterium]